MEETFTDKEFCKALKVDRATSARWREQGIVGFLKLPNGQIRYYQRHIDQALKMFEELAALAVQNSKRSVKGRVVNIRVAERGNDGSMAQNA